MKNKINIAELLEDCPKGMELYSPIFGKLKFNEVNAINNRILVVQQNDYIAEFESDGRLINCKNGECLLFPSKGKTTWEGFVPPCKFKDGDVVAGENCVCSYITIFRKFIDDTSFSHHVCLTSFGNFKVDDISDNANLRLATEEEKNRLFDTIKDNGYKWNADTKTLERLAESSEEEQVGMNELGMMWQKQALIKKACEWLENYAVVYIEEFKKAMEE